MRGLLTFLCGPPCPREWCNGRIIRDRIALLKCDTCDYAWGFEPPSRREATGAKRGAKVHDAPKKSPL